MSAELLALAADYIDTLLEDWYPGLGAREGNKTVESVPYVNRVVPCPFCVSNAEQLPHLDDSEVGHMTVYWGLCVGHMTVYWGLYAGHMTVYWGFILF